VSGFSRTYNVVVRVIVFAAVIAQTLLPRPSTVQQISVTPSASISTAARRAAVTLWADVTPNRNMHVYATNKQGFAPLSLVVKAQPGIEIGKVSYPAAEVGLTPGIDALTPVPMYTKPFRVAQAITVSPSAKSGDVLTIAGVINYQACDDRLRYPVNSLPVTWTVAVK
jgi:hypothetical protein